MTGVQLEKYLIKIKYCRDLDELMKLMINYQVFFHTNNPVIYNIYSDLNNSEMNILHLIKRNKFRYILLKK